MPQHDRALTRAVRARMAAAKEPYTTARDAVTVIHELAADNDWSVAEATAFYDDPANGLLCRNCGWTNGMVCPECPKGCGCETRCSGWRHSDYAHPDDLRDDTEPFECECGASHEYDCVCP